MLCLDVCIVTTTMPQPTEITQFIFGQPLSRREIPMADTLEIRRDLTCSGGSSSDLPLEEPGFEPLVPLCGVVVSRWNRNAGIGEENISKALAAAGTQRSISFAPAIQLHHTSASLGPLGPY